MYYKYETHLHSAPVSKCAQAPLSDSLEYYKSLGYSGVVLTNHFLNGNIGVPDSMPREKQLEFYCKDYFDGLKLTRKIGIDLFFGVEMTFDGRTDFLIYGLTPEWFLDHSEILDLSPTHALELLSLNGAFIVHAHPFREKDSSGALTLYPYNTDAVETVNCDCFPKENRMAELYASHYKLPVFAGSDNHMASEQKKLAGIKTTRLIESEKDFADVLRKGKYCIFSK